MAHLTQRDGYQATTQGQLKEQLYQEIIHYFDKGKVRLRALLPAPCPRVLCAPACVYLPVCTCLGVPAWVYLPVCTCPCVPACTTCTHSELRVCGPGHLIQAVGWKVSLQRPLVRQTQILGRTGLAFPSRAPAYRLETAAFVQVAAGVPSVSGDRHTGRAFLRRGQTQGTAAAAPSGLRSASLLQQECSDPRTLAPFDFRGETAIL